MKRTEPLYRTAALLLLLMLTAACARDDAFDDAATPGHAARTLTITVSDGAYTSALPEADVDTPAAHAATHDATPATRTVDEGSATRFTAGDCIGLYVEKARKGADGHPDSDIELLHRNLPLTYDGTEWKLPAGIELEYDPDEGYDLFYFAYYPYQTDTDMSYSEPDGNDKEGTPATTAPDFFHKLIDKWTPLTNQDTYADYTASDLMVARGSLTPCPDNTSGSLLSFKMQHQMMLHIIRFPGTTCTYTETIDGEEKQQSYDLYTGAGIIGFWMENTHTARRIDNPTKIGVISYYYDYYNSRLEERNGSFSHDYIGESFRGQCRTITITDQSMPATMERTLQEGDFYMKDGSILPADACDSKEMPQEVKKDCLGVVFWVGEKYSPNYATYHWALKTYRGDRLLMHEHPGCTHGLVVALKDAANGGKMKWSEDTDPAKSSISWIETYQPTTDEQKEVKQMISNSDLSWGYSSSRRIQWYRDYARKETYAYTAIEEYAKANATPAGCSGWYFPGDNEMTYMAFGTMYQDDDKHKSAQLNAQFRKAGGDNFQADWYWSTMENSAYNQYIHCIKFDDTNNERVVQDKTKTYRVRAVLAF